MAFGSVLLLKVDPEGFPLPNVKMITWRRRLYRPDGALNHDIYLRMVVDVAADGWAHFDYVKMPEYRSSLRHLIVTQGDTEPVFVEQQRMLGLT